EGQEVHGRPARHGADHRAPQVVEATARGGRGVRRGHVRLSARAPGGLGHNGAGRPEAREMSSNRNTGAVYVISVAAELAGVHPQTLRIYERKGLLEPARTDGGSRRYSEDDIELLRHIQQLTEQGLNLAGVKRVLDMEAQLDDMRAEVA